MALVSTKRIERSGNTYLKILISVICSTCNADQNSRVCLADDGTANSRSCLTTKVQLAERQERQSCLRLECRKAKTN